MGSASSLDALISHGPLSAPILSMPCAGVMPDGRRWCPFVFGGNLLNVAEFGRAFHPVAE
jgi:hypothetical protein